MVDNSKTVESWHSDEVALFDLSKLVPNRPVTLLKVDCEGCEYEALTSIRSLLEDRSKVQFLAGEIHRSLEDPSEITHAEHTTTANVKALNDIIHQRNCPGFKDGDWWLRC
jgi:hypothetical protein